MLWTFLETQMSKKTQPFDRDTMAKWYAKRHLDTDTGVMEILYLPTNAPPREIRFLEVNSEITETADLEPIDFGVDVGGIGHHVLLVLDITPAQWETIKRGKLALPKGWSLDKRMTFGRK
jgi:hypothetical protein